MVISRINKTKTAKYAEKIVVDIFKYALLCAIGYVVIFPMLSAIVTAIKDEKAFFDLSLYWLPKYISFDSFKVAFDAMDYGQAFLRTLSLNMVSACIEIVMCAVVAYGFARFDFKLKKLFYFLLIMTIVIPTQIYIVSMILNFKSMDVLGILGLFNKLTGIDIRPNILNTNLTFYLPSLFAMGLRSGILIYIYIQFFSGLPKELEEAASIDGAGPFKTFYSIAIPSSSVVIVTVSVFSIVWHWNDYYLSQMYMTGNYPLAVKLSAIEETLKLNNRFMGAASTSLIDASKMAGCVLFILPVLIFYLIIQNKFVKSIDRVGITG